MVLRVCTGKVNSTNCSPQESPTDLCGSQNLALNRVNVACVPHVACALTGDSRQEQTVLGLNCSKDGIWG